VNLERSAIASSEADVLSPVRGQERNGLTVFLFSLSSVVCYVVLAQVGWGESVIARSLLWGSLLIGIAYFVGWTDYLYIVYFLLLPLLAGFDRYSGDILYEVTGWIARLGTTQGLLLATAFLLTWRSILSIRAAKAPMDRLNASVLIFFAFVTLSLSYAPDDELALQFYLSNTPFYLAAYAAARFTVSSLRKAELLFAAMVLSLAAVVVSRYLYQEIDFTSRINVNYIYGGAVNYSQVLVLVLPFSLMYAYANGAWKARGIFIVCFWLILFEVAFSQTRGAYLAAGVSCLYFLVKTKAIKLSPLPIIVIGLFGVFALYVLEFRTVGDKEVFEDSNLYRLEQILTYLDAVRFQAVTGLGFGAESFIVDLAKGTHNTFLSITVDTGLLGLVSFVMVYFYSFRYSRSLRKQHEGDRRFVVFCRACEASLIAQLVHANTTGNEMFYSVPMQIVFHLFGVFAALSALHRLDMTKHATVTATQISMT
jgi:O-antigen ligase